MLGNVFYGKRTAEEAGRLVVHRTKIFGMGRTAGAVACAPAGAGVLGGWLAAEPVRSGQLGFCRRTGAWLAGQFPVPAPFSADGSKGGRTGT